MPPPRKTKAERRKNRQQQHQRGPGQKSQKMMLGEDYYGGNQYDIDSILDPSLSQTMKETMFREGYALEHEDNETEPQNAGSGDDGTSIERHTASEGHDTDSTTHHSTDQTSVATLGEALDLPNSHVLANKQNFKNLTHRELRRLSKSQRKKLEKLKRNKEKEKMRGEVLESLKRNSLSDDQLKLIRQSGFVGQRVTMKEHLQREMSKKKLGLSYTTDYLVKSLDTNTDNDESEVEDDEGNDGANDLEQVTTTASALPSQQPVTTDSAPRPSETAFKISTPFRSTAVSSATSTCGDTQDRVPASEEGTGVNDTNLAKLQRLRAKNAKLASEGKYAIDAKWTPELPKERNNDSIMDAVESPNLVATAALVGSFVSQSSEINPSINAGKTTNSTSVTAATPSEQSSHSQEVRTKRCVHVKRSKTVQKSRMNLPVCQMEQEIMEKIIDNDVLVLCGETGSGKTTQVPQFLYEYGYGLHGHSIAVTQPRRVAAVSMSRRVSFELGGGSMKKDPVGYQIRFDSSNVGRHTRIKFLTDGILLREIQEDLILRKYSCILIDEAHERNVNTDVLIGLLSRALKVRNELARSEKELKKPESERIVPLKLVIMSATLRVDDFVQNEALFPTPPPLIRVTARQHPVTIHFSKRTELQDYVREAERKICKMHKQLPEGGILVFLTGQDEIEYLCKQLQKRLKRKKRKYNELGNDDDAFQSTENGQNTESKEQEPPLHREDEENQDDTLSISSNESEGEEMQDGATTTEQHAGSDATTDETSKPAHVLPLYAALPQTEQSKVFQSPPQGHRLIVVATNVAETSLTIPNIRYVVDTGRTKRKVYDKRSGMSRFEIGWISQASAEQRAGRAGRTRAGHAYRLYSSAVFQDQFPSFEDPEIVSLPITSMVLQLKAMGIVNIQKFPFPTPPPMLSLKRSLKSLINIGALTPIFSSMSHSEQSVAEVAWETIKKQLASKATDNDNYRMDAESLALKAYLNEPVFKDKDGSDRSSREFLKQISLPSVEGERLTALGRTMTVLPLSPHLSKLVLFAFTSIELAKKEARRIQDLAILMVALASVDNITVRSRCKTNENSQESSNTAAGDTEEEQAQEIGNTMFNFHSAESDMLTYLNIAGAFLYEQSLSAEKAEAFCRTYTVKYKALREVLHLRDQLWRYINSTLSGHLTEDKLYEKCVATSSADTVEDEARRVNENGESREYSSLLHPPTEDEKLVLRQLLCISSLERVARRASSEEVEELLQRIGHERKKIKKGSWVPYICCDEECPYPLFVHPSSSVCSNSVQNMPNWIVFEEIISTSRSFMRGVSAIDPNWLPKFAGDTPICRLGKPLEDPLPYYDKKRDGVLAYVRPYYGDYRWELPLYLITYPQHGNLTKEKVKIFARALLEGEVFPQLKPLRSYYISPPSHLTRALSSRTTFHDIVTMLEEGQSGIEGPICSSRSLVEIWKKNPRYLFSEIKRLLHKGTEELMYKCWNTMLEQNRCDNIRQKHRQKGY
eukprot:gb/GECG01015053.1/.p1 GENE.gb/GECG01015053.1/~~gb/GECG01015053.1/.p1  ORF type:complete len:1494 (+),score=233.91 gb/GECG01015053.1/:1-4482(+)